MTDEKRMNQLNEIKRKRLVKTTENRGQDGTGAGRNHLLCDGDFIFVSLHFAVAGGRLAGVEHDSDGSICRSGC